MTTSYFSNLESGRHQHVTYLTLLPFLTYFGLLLCKKMCIQLSWQHQVIKIVVKHGITKFSLLLPIKCSLWHFGRFKKKNKWCKAWDVWGVTNLISALCHHSLWYGELAVCRLKHCRFADVFRVIFGWREPSWMALRIPFPLSPHPKSFRKCVFRAPGSCPLSIQPTRTWKESLAFVRHVGLKNKEAEEEEKALTIH